MARKKKGAKWWEREILEWVAILIAFWGIVAVFCIFFIRRHIIEYHLEHTFGVNQPEFFGSALALYDPVPLDREQARAAPGWRRLFSRHAGRDSRREEDD